jgi:hypothetical protein
MQESRNHNTFVGLINGILWCNARAELDCYSRVRIAKGLYVNDRERG